MSNLIHAVVQTLNQLHEAPSGFASIAKNALHKAADTVHGSQEHHKWFGVYNAAAAQMAHDRGDAADEKHHNKQYDHHANEVKDKNWHDRETEHWAGFNK
jgi:hypothetical protein